jgi:hypothetical protein
MSVSMGPGATQFTNITLSAISLPNAVVNAMTPALAAEYAASSASPSLPANDAMLTMRNRARGSRYFAARVAAIGSGNARPPPGLRNRWVDKALERDCRAPFQAIDHEPSLWRAIARYDASLS